MHLLLEWDWILDGSSSMLGFVAELWFFLFFLYCSTRFYVCGLLLEPCGLKMLKTVCQKKVKNGVFSFGCFLATVLCFALLALQWERLSIFCWLVRRQAHMLRAQQGIPVSEYGVLVDMIRVPDWAFEVAGLETRGFDQDSTGYHPGLFLTSAQREAVEALIQELPKFRLKAVPTDCSECPICLEEFHVGNEVRGMPCAHNFHVECIDEWLRLNVKCPRCRSSVFPNLDLSALSDLRSDTDQTPTNGYITRQPSSLSTSSPVPAAHTVNTQASIPTLP
ncbi:E3 ubiquitin-protein ligase SIS3-like isoform X2 [Momordica charantia]|uniref:E3 ubiquitin-protein ligase SIS3-like isoform X2 n=1 Tax=Momordica charantia TaxID=3673 RepID=A0A6J1CAQ4_MOMCH|nr:E3 ubiquitin-protein ligase SIS3-like isoform X2 [Momordica charantia]